MRSLRRIAVLLGAVLGILLAALAINAFRTIVVSGTATNPVCLIPGANLLCGSLIPSETGITFTIEGLGLLVVQGILTLLVVAGIAGFFLLLVLKRREPAMAWAWLVVIAALVFLATFSFGYVLAISQGLTCTNCIEKNLGWKLVWLYALWLVLGVGAAILAAWVFVRSFRAPSGGDSSA